MKVKIVKYEDDYDHLITEGMFIDGKSSLSVGPLSECPEDAIIGRDLVSCSDVYRYMKMALEAGKKGEELELESVKAREKDECWG